MPLAFGVTACFGEALPPWLSEGGSSGGELHGTTDASWGQREPMSGPGADVETSGVGGAGRHEHSFIDEPDGGWGAGECSVWDQDCPAGEKCMPWASDGGNAWDATKCFPIAPDPAQPSEPCTVEGSRTSGIDDCDVASMCWHIDPDTLTGLCRSFCVGGYGGPICENPKELCLLDNTGVVIPCVPACDPVLQDCPVGQGCYAFYGDGFVCSDDRSGDAGRLGDKCDSIGDCAPGLACVAAEGVPECVGSQGCCAPYCALDDPNPPCAPGQTCVAWFEEDDARPGWEDVGVCFIPS